APRHHRHDSTTACRAHAAPAARAGGMLGAMLAIRAITDDEADAFRACLLTTFGSEVSDDPGGVDRVRALITPGRMWGAFDGRTVVATAGTFALTVGVPGGTIA